MGFWDTLGKIGKGAAMAFPVTGLPILAAGQLAKGLGGKGGGGGQSSAVTEMDKLIGYLGNQSERGVADIHGYTDTPWTQMSEAMPGLARSMAGSGAQASYGADIAESDINSAISDLEHRYGFTAGKDGKMFARPGRDSQLEALSKYKGLSDPSMTAAERSMMMQAQNEREQQERAARDASLSDMSARGIRGGGAEIANMFNTQQATAQSRVMADLGAQKNAIDRSMTALQGYADTAGKLRDSDDANAQDVANTRMTGAQTKGTTRTAAATAEQAALKGSADMWGNYVGTGLDIGKGLADTRMGGTQLVGDAMKAKAGTIAADEAAKKAEENKSLFQKMFGGIL